MNGRTMPISLVLWIKGKKIVDIRKSIIYSLNLPFQNIRMAGNPLFRLLFVICLILAASSTLFAQPSANFSVSAVSGCSPLTETFTDATTGGTSPYKYFWNLGNSNTSTLQNA